MTGASQTCIFGFHENTVAFVEYTLKYPTLFLNAWENTIFIKASSHWAASCEKSLLKNFISRLVARNSGILLQTPHKMKNVIQFGENVPGYDIPVLNEREIRAAAGILFMIIYTSLMLILFKNDFRLAKYAIVLFFIDFTIRVFINPKFSPSLIVGRLIVSNQVPEYVGAKQKKFAWIIGVLLSGSMFALLVVVNAYSPFTGIICLLCLIFLFFESVFGICLACKVYRVIYGEKAQYCPGEVCDIKSRQPIQHTSRAQMVIVFAFIVSIFLMIRFFAPVINIAPHNMFGK
jgi:hypothetical protein